MRKKRENIIIVLITASSRKEAIKIARAMIQEKRAACVSILPAFTSIYRWQGKVQKSQETLLILKTTRRQYSALEESVCAIHSYEVPEVISISVDKGLPQYVDWVMRETAGN
jgi:periplasmic divalent cation tolerance protein